MREVGKIEARHEARYLALAAQVSGNKVFHYNHMSDLMHREQGNLNIL